MPILAAIVIGAFVVGSSYLIMQRFLHAQAISVSDPEITLNFPDASVTYKVRDLPMEGADIVIPSNDNSDPSFAYDTESGTVSLTSSPYDYRIKVSDLQSFLTHPVPETQSVTPNYDLTPRYQSRVNTYNARLNNVYRSELIIKLKDGSTESDLPLPPALLRSLIMPTSLDLSVPLSIDEPVLLDYVLSRLTPKQKEYFSLSATTENVRKGVSDRLTFQTTPVVLGVDDGPSSEGDLANKYLEVDLSQQKMYFFMNGRLFKSYKVGTGLDYPTPIGDFHIMNKAPLAFSGIYNVWMPYWMAFKYANDVGAFLGFHEKAYARIEKGVKIYNHDREVGDKLTGGCVALDPIDAKEVFTLSDVGMLVRIVP